MSYCRFSSDDWSSDLYCYEDDLGGFTTHVARIRYVLKETLPLPIAFDDHNIEAWLDRDEKVMAAAKGADRVPIDLPHAGETFNDPDLQSFLDRIVYLKSLGYRVPDYTIQAIQEEIEEAKP